MVKTLTDDTALAIDFLEKLFAHTPLRRVAFRLWDGSLWPTDLTRPAIITVKHPGALREMFGSGTELGLAEAYLRDEFDVEGEMESAFEIADALSHNNGWLTMLRRFQHLRRLPEKSPSPFSTNRGLFSAHGTKHSLARDRDAVSFHYDVSNDFFRLWLDQRMIYSCAYFERPDALIDEAQEAKLRHICRKLRLRPGQRLLDIGCGWGGLAIFAAQHFHAQVTAITLSQNQAELATERVRAAALADSVDIQLKDYRELRVAEPFDAIVSVGMAEHVGAEELPNYFKSASALLRPGGVFLNHAIGEGVRPKRTAGRSFLKEYVFPDSDIPPIPDLLRAAETAGLEVRDVENLREHYALTLRRWGRRLEAFHRDAMAFVDEPTFRVWRLYMAGAAHGFAAGHLAVYQTLLSKTDGAGHSLLPLTRRDWYSLR